MGRITKLILMLTVLVSGPAFAEPGQLYTTARFLARGGAMGADVDDYNVLFVNPAGIPLVTDPILKFEFLLEGSSGISQNLTALFGHADNTRWKITDPTELAALNGLNTRARIGFVGAYINDLMSFAFITNGELDTAYDTSALPTANVFSAADIAVQFGMAKGFFDKKKFRIGGTGKLVYRGNKYGNYNFTQLSTESIKPFQNPYANEGMAFAVDLGMQYTWQVNESELSMGLTGLDLCMPFSIQPKIFGDGNTGQGAGYLLGRNTDDKS
jgi:hypothetical protein